MLIIVENISTKLIFQNVHQFGQVKQETAKQVSLDMELLLKFAFYSDKQTFRGVLNLDLYTFSLIKKSHINQ